MAHVSSVAYLVNQYPSVSHTFIRREILALEAAGTRVARYAVRGWATDIADPADVRERQQTRYLLRSGPGGLLAATLVMMATRPRRFWAAVRSALALSKGRARPLPYYAIWLAEAAQLARWLLASDAQHLHAHFGTNSTAVAQLAGVLSGVGYSFTVHGPEEFDGPSVHSLALKIDAARFVVAISSFGRSQLYRWTPLAQWSKVKVVRCGVDQSFRAAPPASEDRLPDTHFVCVGRICEQKGQLLLMEALARLRDRGMKARLVLAGDGPMRGDVERRADELGLRDQLRITGWIGGEQVRNELLAARFMVLPSFAEGLPVVIMEAMALRRPVISTYVAGIPELVQPDANGWLVPAGDVEALAEVMARSVDVAEQEWRTMGAAARERVLARHDIDTEAAKLRGHFAEAVAAHPPAAP